jgi:hypothetical protein
MPARSIWLIQLLQVIQEELAKYKQQAEKTRVQKLHQVSECFLIPKIPCFFYGCWQARSMQGKSPFGSSSNSISSGGLQQDERLTAEFQ